MIRFSARALCTVSPIAALIVVRYRTMTARLNVITRSRSRASPQWLVAFLIFASCRYALGATDNDAESVFETVKSTVWLVKADLPAQQAVGIGTAVLIAPSFFATACHVVDRSTKVMLTNGNHTLRVDQVLRDPDRSRDLCLLRVTLPPNISPAVIAPISTLKVGQRVFAIASPRGLELTLTDGLVSSLRHNTADAQPIIQSSTPVTGGSSGGGLFDTEGRLIGVFTSVSANTENFAFSYPAEWIAQLPHRFAGEMEDWEQQLKAIGIQFNDSGVPISSGYAKLDNVDALPAATEYKAALTTAYKEFLLLGPPRAFVLTSDGHYGSLKDASSLRTFFADCQRQHLACKLYALNDTVVWKTN